MDKILLCYNNKNMDNEFIIKLIVSFLGAGIWITVMTLLAEKLGSKVGGLIANLPANILFSLMCVGFIQGADFAAEASRAAPIGMVIVTIFIFSIINLLPYGLKRALGLSILIWLPLAVLTNLWEYKNWLGGIIIYLITTAVLFWILEHYCHLPAVEQTKKKYTAGQILGRAVFAGSIIALVIILAEFSPPYLVGIFATFPSGVTSTIYILTRNQSPAFAQATGKILVLSSSNIIIYALGVFLTYPLLGVIWGTIISFLASFIWVWIFHPVIKKVS